MKSSFPVSEAAVMVTMASLVLLLGGFRADAEERASELAVVKSFLEHSPQAQLLAVAGIRAEADLLVAPYMQNPALMVRQEQGLGPGSGFSTTVVGAEFMFDVAGKSDLRKESARIRSAQHQVAVREQLLLGICAVRQKMLELEHAHSRVDVLQQFESRYEWLLQTVKALAKGLEKSQFDVSRASWRLEAYKEVIAEQQVRAQTVRNGISAMVGCPVAEGIESMMSDTLPDLEELLERSKKNHPIMAAMRVLVKTANAEMKVASRSWIPDLGVYGAYRIDAMETAKEPLHGYEFGLTMALPLFRKGAAEEGRAEAAAVMARLNSARSWQSIRVQVISAHGAALSQLSLYEDLSAGSPEDYGDIWGDALKAYKAGVVVLGELVEMLQTEEARALARVRIRHEARMSLLKTYCAAGVFPEQEINNLLNGDER